MAKTPVSMQSNTFSPFQGNATPITIGLGQNFFMTMPYSGIPKTPYFDGRNVTDFLNRFSDLCADYKLLNQEKIKRFSWYCDMKISQSIKSIWEWKDQD